MGSRSSEIIVGLGHSFDDQSFVKALKCLHEETRMLVEGWRRFLDTDASEVEEVFDQKPAQAWTVEAIVCWRRREQRHRELSWFGYLIGCGSSGAASGVVILQVRTPMPTVKPSVVASTRQ